MERKRKSSTRASVDGEASTSSGASPNKREKTETSVIQYTDVTAASFRIRKGVKETPLKKSEPLSEMLGMNIFFKKEFLLPTGSFKERGARNTLELLTEEQKRQGVIAASAGNHALALAHHGHQLSIPVVVMMPEVAPLMKVERCRQYGAEIIVHGRDIGEAKERALELARERDMVYVNGYDDPRILAGQGTAALEVVSQMERLGVDCDAVVIPVGGGGLLAGMAVTLKHFMPSVEVIGVESEQCASFSEAMKAGRPVYTKALPTLADGLAVPEVGANAFACARPCVDQMVVVSEKDIALAILRLVEIEKSVVEGAGATGLAACLSGKLDHLQGKNVVVMLCGGNIDTTTLGRCLERGLAADGRMATFKVVLEDRPGSIAGLTRLLSELKCSVKDITHERTWLQASIHHVEVRTYGGHTLRV
jgi:threonine dehydratase